MSNQQRDNHDSLFPGFRKPSYTQVPDELFDVLLPELSGAELKVLLYIIRRTFGFKRDSDAISLGQMLTGIVKRDGERLDAGTGLTKKTLLKALSSLIARQIIFAERRASSTQGNIATVYSLNVQGSTPLGGISTPPLGEKVAQGSGVTPPSPRRRNSPTQETGEQETVEQDFYPSNIRKVQPEHGEGETVDLSTSEQQTSANHRGAASVGAILSTRAPRAFARQARPETASEEYQRIQAWIADRAREFYDKAPLRSSTTRAWNLFKISRLSIEQFEGLIFQAKSLTLEATGRITKTVDDPVTGVRRKSKMAYFFATLESLADPAKRAATAPADAPAATHYESSAGRRRGHARSSTLAPNGTRRDGRPERRSEHDGPYRDWVKS